MKKIVLACIFWFSALTAWAQPVIYLSTTNGIYVIPVLQIGGQQFTNLLGSGLTNDNGKLRLSGPTSGDVFLTNNQTFLGSNQFTKSVTADVANVVTLHLVNPGGISSGFTGGGTEAEARTQLGLHYDFDVQVFRLPLLQLYVALAADGDMPYRSADGTITNTVSTAAGRTLLSAASSAAQRTILGAIAKDGDTLTVPFFVPYVPYSANWTNSGSNGVPTWRSIAEVLEDPNVGIYITSVDTNFNVVLGGLSLTNLEAGASGRLVRKSQIDNFAAPGTNSVIVDVFTNATSTWTMNPLAKFVRVAMFGGGGGGGSGTVGTNGGWATGGSGGSGAGYTEWLFSASELPSTVECTNGLGGAGGASQTTNLAVGLPGFNGGSSFFGVYAEAVGGLGGTGGVHTSSTVSTPAGTTAMYLGGTGGQNTLSGQSINNRPGGSGGGAGGGGYRAVATVALVTNAPGAAAVVDHAVTMAGGIAGTVGSIHGGNGTSWVLGAGYMPRSATGGGGGYPGFTGNGNGGNGGWPGGGGGGGSGAKVTPSVSGAGGTGGDGVIVVIQYL